MKTDKKQTENLAESGNVTKPKLCTVAVLCLRYKDFKIFEKDNKKINEEFIWVYDYKCVVGRIFNRIEKVRDWYEMKDASDILEGVEIRLRSNCA